MIHIEQSLVINRPIGEVFAYMADPANNSQWQSGLVESRATSEGPVAVGARGMEVRQFLGRRIESTYEITQYEADKNLGFKVISGPIPMEGGYTFESIEGGTRVAFEIQGEVGGFFRLGEPIVSRMVRRQVEADFNNLKDLLEAHAEGSA